MRLYYSILIFLCSLLSLSQGFKVRHYLPGVKNHLSKAIFETAPGNYIGGGIIVDSAQGIYSNRLCIMGLDAQGQVQWTKKYGNYKFEYLNNSLISRSFYKRGNNIYYTGCVKDSNNKYVGILVKFNLNGDTLWQKVFRDSQEVIPQLVTSSVDGGFLITGFFQSTNRSVLLIKTDINGDELWRKKISKVNPDVNDGKAVLQDSASKKIVIVGYQYIVGSKSYDNVLIVDSLGTKLNQLTFGGYGGILVDLIQTKDSYFIAVGQKIYPTTVNGTNLIKSFALKFDVNNPSTLIWKLDSFDKLGFINFFTCIKELPNGDLLLTGAIDTLRLLNQNTNCLARLTLLKPNGVLVWNRYYNYKTNAANVNNHMGIRSIELTSDGGYVAAIECINFPNPNPFFFVKWDSLGCDSTLAYCQAMTIGLEKNSPGNADISVYPNPGQGLFYLSVPEAEAGEELWVNVTDLSGRIVKQVEIEQGKQLLDLKELSSGIYVVNVKDQKRTLYNGRLVKQD